MKIKYSQKLDKNLFIELNKMGDKLSPVFGFKFPKLNFDKKLVFSAKLRTKRAFIDEKLLKKMMKEVYGREMPDVIIYINTTPFSTWNREKKWLSISFKRDGIKFFQAVCHEMNHFMYDYCFKTQKYQDTEIKETLTVLNNVFGMADKGWDKFSKQRERVLKFYNKTKNFKKTINYTKYLFKNKSKK